MMVNDTINHQFFFLGYDTPEAAIKTMSVTARLNKTQ